MNIDYIVSGYTLAQLNNNECAYLKNTINYKNNLLFYEIII